MSDVLILESAAPPGASLDAATLSRLAAGEVIVTTEPVEGSPAPRLIVWALIDASPEAVWVHISNPAAHEQFMPRVKRSEELWREGNENRMRTTIDMPFPLKNLTATSKGKHFVEVGVRWERAWKMEHGDYNVNEGSWIIEPFPGQPSKTLALYRAIVHPKVMIPKAIQSAVQEKAMPKMIEALRERVKSTR
ncbi:MAG: SRPBCC family protein [Myxococcota bacterium]